MNRKNKRFLSMVLTFTVLASASSGIARTTVSAKEVTGASKDEIKKIMHQQIQQQKQDAIKKLQAKKGNKEKEEQKQDPNEIVRVVVVVDGQTSSTEKNGNGNDVNSKINQEAQLQVKNSAKKLEGATIRQSYNSLINGFSMTIKRSEIPKLRKMPGVKSVTESRKFYPTMTNAKALTQAYGAWQELGYKGEGMVVSIIDTGIDVKHKDMRLTEDISKAKIKRNEVKDGFTDKVPYGHNFADGNDVVKDADGNSMHGMHVAGIVGANGTEEEVKSLKAIQGVAPESQLLAMKVFSNVPGETGAYDDDIIAAIEDSVKHKADVINMSLGGPGGLQDENDPVEMAIKSATDKGTLVVIAAGNETNSATLSSWNNIPTNQYGIPDVAIVGQPGTAKDAMTVASFENSKLTGDALSFTIGEKTDRMFYIASEVKPAGKLTGKYDLVDCGTDTSGFKGKDVKGKIAIVKRDSAGSKAIRNAAQTAGAVGLIIYSEDGNEAASGMTVAPGLIPAAWVGNSNGKKLIAGISKGEKIFFDGTLITADNPLGNDMSSFTSFGPTPNLDFKPEITAPGGNIFSTVNNNQYETMSGTSMATPHTAGSEALIMQGIKKLNPSITGRDLVELAKKTAINTAAPQLDKFNPDKSIPYSPRRQGAGMIQIKDAITNNVTVTDKYGNADIALKQIGKASGFELIVKNYGSSAATYKVNAGKVLTELRSIDEDMHIMEAAIPEAKIWVDGDVVTVPANSSIKLKVTINLPDNFPTENFVEGYIKLVSNDAKIPSLNVPYMGFYGDWSKPTIVDKPMWEEGNLTHKTALVNGTFFGFPLYAGYCKDANGNPSSNPDIIAVSPNGDGYSDIVMPAMGILRNAKVMNMDIVKKVNGQDVVVSRVNVSNNVRRPQLETSESQVINEDGTWDGGVYDSITGTKVTAPEGQYYYRITSKSDIENAKEQTVYMPVKVDVTAPEITDVHSSTDNDGICTLSWKSEDKGGSASGIMNAAIVVNLSRVEDYDFVEPITENNGVFTCKVQLDNSQYNQIAIGVNDNADNTGLAIVNQNSGLNFTKLDNNLTLGKSDLNKDGTFKVVGYASDDVNKVIINNVEAQFDSTHIFAINVPLALGDNTINVVALDAKNNEIKDYCKSYKVIVDVEAPTLNITAPDMSGKTIYVTDKNEVTIKGNVKDNICSLGNIDLYIAGKHSVIKADGTFEKTIKVSGITNIEVAAVDACDNDTVKNITVVAPAVAPLNLSFDNIKPLTIVSGKANPDLKGNVFTIKGSVNKTPDVFTINGKKVTIKEDGTFEYPMTLVETSNVVAIHAEDAGKVVADYGYKIWFDKTAPEFNISEPTVQANGKIYTNKDEITLKGQVADNALGYSFFINGDCVQNKLYIAGTSVNNRSNFEYTTKVTNGSKIVVECVDSFGNKAKMQEYEVVIDKTAPVINVTGLVSGNIYKESVQPVISTDKANTVITSTLNGKVYNGETIVQNGRYELNISAKDIAGNITTATYKFDISRPVPVINNSIVVTPQSIAIDGKINVKFTGNIVKAINFAKLSLVDANGSIIPASFDINNDTLVVTPSAALQYQSKYTVIIPENALNDIYGNSIDAIKYDITTIAMPMSSLTPATPVPSTLTPATPVPSVLTKALPKTGSAIDMKVMMSMGCALTLAGIAFLVFKKKEN